MKWEPDLLADAPARLPLYHPIAYAGTLSLMIFRA
jgi:hypothetical protein